MADRPGHLAVILARIASGESTASLTTMLRNPRFLSCVRKPRSSTGQELSELRDEAHARGSELTANICDLEMAKLLLSQGETDQARHLLERSLAFSDRGAETEGTGRVRELLART